MVNTIKAALVGILSLGFFSTAQATPVLWTLNGTLLNIGTNPSTSAGPAGGSFVYDDDTDMFSDIMLTTTSASPSGGLTFTQFLRESNSGLIFGLTSPGTPEIVLVLRFVSISDLTNTGGILTIGNSSTNYIAESSCNFAGCANDQFAAKSNWDSTATNTLVGRPTVVPEPGTAALLALGLLSTAFARRRRR